MKKIMFFELTIVYTTISFAQIPLTVAPGGGNKKASVSE